MKNLSTTSSQDGEKNPLQSRTSKNRRDQKTSHINSGKLDETGTDPKRYEPDKFEKGTNEKSGGEGTAESAAEEMDKL